MLFGEMVWSSGQDRHLAVLLLPADRLHNTHVAAAYAVNDTCSYPGSAKVMTMLQGRWITRKH